MWRLSGNLVSIRADIKGRWPNVTVYDIGDTSHQAGTSDHNPDSRGIVCAIDVMFSVGPEASAIVAACRGREDLRYIIHNRTMWHKRDGWKPTTYTGSDPHTNHVHISCEHTTTSDNDRTPLWTIQVEDNDMYLVRQADHNDVYIMTGNAGPQIVSEIMRDAYKAQGVKFYDGVASSIYAQLIKFEKADVGQGAASINVPTADEIAQALLRAIASGK